MSEMIERVARAICAARGEEPDAYDPEQGAGARPWMAYEAAARAAIEAMREPTREMVEAAEELYRRETLRSIGYDEFFRAMIDAALGDLDRRAGEGG